jgi:hypothetical protein
VIVRESASERERERERERRERERERGRERERRERERERESVSVVAPCRRVQSPSSPWPPQHNPHPDARDVVIRPEKSVALLRLRLRAREEHPPVVACTHHQTRATALRLRLSGGRPLTLSLPPPLALSLPLTGVAFLHAKQLARELVAAAQRHALAAPTRGSV